MGSKGKEGRVNWTEPTQDEQRHGCKAVGITFRIVLSHLHSNWLPYELTALSPGSL